MTHFKIFSGHPKGLAILSLVCGAERAAHYGVRAVLLLFLSAAFFKSSYSTEVFCSWLALCYIAPLMGGYLADRVLGSRNCTLAGGLLMTAGYVILYFAAALVHQSIFYKGAAPVASVDNSTSAILLSIGMVLLVIGTGLFKPMSSMVSRLYAEGDARVDTAYSILYGSFNACGLLGPIICGFLGEGDWSCPSAFKGAFLAAAILQVVSVIAYLIYRDEVTDPSGKLIGLRPEKKDKVTNSSSSSGYGWKRVLLCIVVAVAMLVLLGQSVQNITDGINVVICTASVCVPLMMVLDKRLTSHDRLHLIVIFFLTLISIAYWAIYEQSATSLVYCARDMTARTIGGFKIPVSWLSSVNPLCIIGLSVVMPIVWRRMGKREPNPITKQSLGLAIMSASFAILYFAVRDLDAMTKISMLWIVGIYALHSVSEMCLSVTGMSFIMKLSPVQMTSLVMSLWLSSSAVANIVAGKIAGLYVPGQPAQILGFTVDSMADLMLVCTAIGAAGTIILVCASPLLNRLIGDKH